MPTDETDYKALYDAVTKELKEAKLRAERAEARASEAEKRLSKAREVLSRLERETSTLTGQVRIITDLTDKRFRDIDVIKDQP
jgi:flagellin-specific chaperone FliS